MTKNKKTGILRKLTAWLVCVSICMSSLPVTAFDLPAMGREPRGQMAAETAGPAEEGSQERPRKQEQTSEATETQTKEQAPAVTETQTESQAPAVTETQTEEQAPTATETQTEEQAPAVTEAQTESQAPAVTETQTEEQTPAVTEAQTESQALEDPGVQEGPQAQEESSEEISEQESETETETETESESDTEGESEKPLKKVRARKTAQEIQDHTMRVVWYPGNAPERGEYQGGKYVKVTFSIGEGDQVKTYDLSDYQSPEKAKELRELLGLSESDPLPQLRHSTAGTHDVFTVTGPGKIEERIPAENPEGSGDGEDPQGEIREIPVVWRLTDLWENPELAKGKGFLPAQHYNSYDGAENVYVHHKDSSLEIKVEVRDGDIHQAAEVFKDKLVVSGSRIGKDDGGYFYTDKFGEIRRIYPELNFTPGDKIGFFYLTVTGIPTFTEMDEEIIYSVKVPENNAGIGNLTGEKYDGDYYQAEYDNRMSDNFGGNTVETHENGLLILTLTGEKVYEATKIWLDDGIASGKINRPATTWTLWRYVQNGVGNYQSASAVRDGAGSQITWTDIEKEDRVTCTTAGKLPAGEILPKYNTDGYPYVYLAREELSGGDHYEKIFGEVGDDGTVSGDILPEGTDSREDADISVYHGGVLSNRRTDTIEISQSKTWVAAAHEADLSNVVVELTLLRSNSEDGPYEAAQEDGKNFVRYMTGFRAEELTKTLDVTVNRYDEHGHPLYYKWEETGVYEIPKGAEGSQEEQIEAAVQGGNKLTKGENGKSIMVLSHNRQEDGTILPDGEEHYETSVRSDGTIVNTLVGTTSYIVKKTWLGADRQPIAAPEGAWIEWELHQNDQPLAEWTKQKMDGTENWDVLVENLPKFDNSGAKHEYIAWETACHAEGYGFSHCEYNRLLTETESKVSLETNTAEFFNAPVGVGKSIQVRKQWIDDGDAACRRPVTVEVWRTGGTAAEGVAYPDKMLATVTLDVSNNWWKTVGVTEYKLKNGTPGTFEQWQADYPDVPSPTAEHIFEANHYYIKEAAVEDGTLYQDIELKKPAAGDREKDRYVATGSHVYHIDYVDTAPDGSDGEGFYTVTNRRVGVINLAVTKTWLDGGKSAEERSKLNARIRLISNSNVKITENSGVGGDSVQMDGATGQNLADLNRPILNPDGNPVKSVQMLDGNTGEDQTQEIYFYNLPKYDVNGAVVHYEILEESGDADQKNGLAEEDYVSSIRQTDYIVGEHHTNDIQAFSVVNKREKSVDVVFHKRWIDRYRYEENQRPDLYLTLYTGLKDEQTVEPTGYRDVEWKAVEVTTRNTDHYNQTAVFRNQPRYDENGAELIYYASEHTHVNHGNLDYIDPRYEYQGKSYSEVRYADGKYQVVNNIEGDALRQYAGEGENTVVLHENGTFVNELRSTVTVAGKKVWKNVPAGIPNEDLPVLEIQVYQLSSPDDPSHPLPADSKKVSQFRTEELKEGGADSGYSVKYLNGSFEFQVTQIIDENGTPQGPLPKYDEDGNFLYYAVREEVVYDGLEHELNTAYESLPGEVHDYVITNVYVGAGNSKNNGSLKLSKNWELPAAYTAPAGTKFPGITFTLKRHYESKNPELNVDHGKTAPETVQVITVPASVPDGNGKAQWETVIENLPIYAPNGKPYYYFVEESIPKGYTAKTMGEGGKLQEASYADTATLRSVEVSLALALAPDVPGMLRDAVSQTPELAFTNVYATKETEISGEKQWKDFYNASGIRPGKDELLTKLNLYRYTDSAENGTDVLSWEKISWDDVTFAWTSNGDDNADAWGFTITGLDDYAPTGALWCYALVEGSADANGSITPNIPEGYLSDPEAQESGKVRDENGKISGLNLVNRSYKTASVKKDWDVQADNIRPKEITVKLQFRVDGGSWQDAVLANLQSEDVVDGSVSDLTQIRLDDEEQSPFAKDNAYQITAQMGWSYTSAKLPAKVRKGGDIKEISWRFVETKIGEIPVTTLGDTQDAIGYDPAGSYQPEQGAYTPGTASDEDFGTDSSSIKNATRAGEVTSLAVTKKWIDNDNEYGLRPKNDAGTAWQITVKLQRRAKGSSDAWEDVTDENGKPITKTITGQSLTDNEESYTFYDLPKQDGSTPEASAEWEYRAAEQGSMEQSGYEIAEETAENGDGTFATTITNSQNTCTLKVTKSWLDGEGTAPRHPEAAFEVLLNGQSFPDRSVKILKEGETEVIWTDLPDIEGAVYSVKEYGVKSENGVTAPDYNREQIAGYYKTENAVTEAGQENGKPLYTASVTNTRTRVALDKLALRNGQAAEIGTPYTVSYGIYEKTAGGEGSKLGVWTEKAVKGSDADGALNVTDELVVTEAGQNLCPALSAAEGWILGLPIGEYILKEEKAPEGYEKQVQSISFAVGADGGVELAQSANAQMGGDGETIRLLDTPITLSLKKTAIGGDASIESAGDLAEFSVTGAFADGTQEKKEVTSESIRNLDGLWIAGETYTFTETKAPRGYKLAAPLEITLEEDGTVKGTTDRLVTVADEVIRIRIRKVDKDTMEELTGAEFTVSPAKGSAFVNLSDGDGSGQEKVIFITDENRDYALNGRLAAGDTYVLTETKAPAGYTLAEPVSFTVNAEGEAVLTDADAPAVTGREGEEVVLAVKDTKLSVSFIKRLTGDSTVQGMPGAEFTLTPEDGKTFADGSEKLELTTKEEDIVVEGLLIAGDSYTLTETRFPEGAMAPAAGADGNSPLVEYRFTIDDKGKVTGLEEDGKAAGNTATCDREANRITCWNEPTALLIAKKDMANRGNGSDQDPMLADCTFEITGRFAPARYGAQAQTGSGAQETITVTTNGKDTAENALKGRLIVGETYTIREVSAPGGFELGGAVSFEVAGTRLNPLGETILNIELEGEKTDKGNNGYWLTYDEQGMPILLQRDEPLIWKLKKTNEQGTPLAGAEFAVTGVFTKGGREETRTYVTDEKGEILFDREMLEASEKADAAYTLRETKAPEGYETPDWSISFRLISTEKDGVRKAALEILEKTSADARQFLEVSVQENVQVLTIRNEEAKPPQTETESETTPGSGTEAPETNETDETDFEEPGTDTDSNDQNKPGNRPGQNGSSNGQTNAPANTGDETQTAGYLWMLAAALLGLAGAAGYRRRRKQ